MYLGPPTEFGAPNFGCDVGGVENSGSRRIGIEPQRHDRWCAEKAGTRAEFRGHELLSCNVHREALRGPVDGRVRRFKLNLPLRV